MPAEKVADLMTLDELLRGIAAAPATEVSSICSDSRDAREGSVFFACEGLTVHGVEYAADAERRDAACIVYDSSTAKSAPAGITVPVIGVEDLAAHLGEIANRFFGRPSEAIDVIGVTGTNGKSTVAWLIAEALKQLGQRCAYAGTLGYGVDELKDPAGMTSPDVIEWHRRLAAFRDAGATAAAVEVSSHALHQHRVQGTRFDTTMLTNLSRDHLDYHGDMRAYGAAKAMLFKAFEARHQIINVDTEFGESLAKQCGDEVIVVSTAADRAPDRRRCVLVRITETRAGGTVIRVRSSWGNGECALPLVGEFNVANAALVLALLLARGVDIEAACSSLEAVSPPPGRLQLIAAHDMPAVYVDYAHTPDALHVVLTALRAHCEGELWCVFGAGGDRDTGKRAIMGRVVADLADRVVVTSDNPRTESPENIIQEILSGMPDPEIAVSIEDRAAAIEFAIGTARKSDVVLIAGKGHENVQIIGDERRPFSDAAIAEGCLAGAGGKA